MTKTNCILAYFVKTLHILFIVYLIVYPFLQPANWCKTKIEENLHHLLYMTVCFSLLVHWYFNDDTCFLTLVEAKLRGKEISDGFIYSIVSPVYKFPQKNLTKLSYTLVIMNFIIVASKFAGKEYFCSA